MEFILFSRATATRYILSLLVFFPWFRVLRLFPFYEGSLLVCQVSRHIVCPALISFTWSWLTCLSPCLKACVSFLLCQLVACYRVSFPLLFSGPCFHFGFWSIVSFPFDLFALVGLSVFLLLCLFVCLLFLGGGEWPLLACYNLWVSHLLNKCCTQSPETPYS